MVSQLPLLKMLLLSISMKLLNIEDAFRNYFRQEYVFDAVQILLSIIYKHDDSSTLVKTDTDSAIVVMRINHPTLASLFKQGSPTQPSLICANTKVKARKSCA